MTDLSLKQNKTMTDLSNITFIIPFFNDSKERIENCKAIINFLTKNFKTNIFIIEEGSEITDGLFLHPSKMIEYYNIKPLRDGIFHRTKMLNIGIQYSKTDYIALYDTDVIFKPSQLLRAYNLLKQGISCVYPYSGKFIDIDRQYITNGNIKEYASYINGSLGGAVFLNKKDYFTCGLENENFISWGEEDKERFERIKKLGFHIVQTEGDCYHIKHPAGINSSPKNPFFENNKKEFEKVKLMEKEELKNYIKGWAWHQTAL